MTDADYIKRAVPIPGLGPLNASRKLSARPIMEFKDFADDDSRYEQWLEWCVKQSQKKGN